MEKGGASMDAGAASQDMWDWELLSSSSMAESKVAAHGGHGRSILDAQETEETNLPPSEDADADMAADECKDIGVVPDETKRSQQEAMPPKATELLPSDGEEEEEAFQSSDAKGVDDDDGGEEEAAPARFAGEEEEEGGGDAKKRGGGKARPDCVVFSVGKLRVNGIGALCSFGVAAATVCIFLVGGRLQHHHKQQQQLQLQQKKIQLEFYGDDKRMQQVVQQTSRLNQAMSSVMGGGGSTRANISFGGFFDGF